MQRKTIEKVIKTKLNEWLLTITDVDLREAVRKNILVSGGSIASLFLREKVNDYDIYLGDIDVLKKLCQYYTKDFGVITILDGREKDALYKAYKEAGRNNDNPDEVGADGDNYYAVSLRNLKPDQIKLVFKDAQPGLRLDDVEGEYQPVYFSPNAISLTSDLQIILRFWGNNQKIHETFDFIHATNFFTFETGLVTNIEALESLLTKQLKYQGSQYPLTSIIRIRKFLARGWNITAGEQLKIMFQISQLDLTNIDTLEEQLIGVDVAYFGMIVSALRSASKGDPNWRPDNAYIVSLIDRIFGE